MSLTFALQALLARHDAYMAEAEEERRQMGASVDKLEDEKKELEATNAKTIEENRYLLGQLEDLNATVSKSDAQILSLNTTLQSTQKELERLTVLAAQASHLEAQLASMEIEQADLQHQLISRKEEERTAVQRWKGAERTVVTLQEAVDRIERESIEERERYAEVVTRFERRRAVERELESAAGRLKGAAVATTLGKENGSNSVVSHFVKDILQDNANLQLGIVELREMLTGSNEEVENLREQVMLHQPILRRPEKSDILTHPEKSPVFKGPEESISELSLKSELAKTLTNEVTSDFHVHHHYHAAPKAVVAKEKPSSFRRPKKRRNTTSPGFGLRTPTSGSQTPRTPRSHGMRSTPVSSADTILSQTSVTIPPSHSQRWSMQSSQASSLPSSPQSAFRSLSLFDTMDDAPDSSRPTTPGSITLGSPEFRPIHCKRGSDVSVRNLSMPSKGPQTISSILQAAGEHNPHDQLGNIASPISDHNTILEEPEDESGIRPLTNDSTSDSNLDYTMQQLRPRLHRASSYESVLSTRKSDIPSLRFKRTQLLNGQGFGPRTPLGTSTTSIKPVTSSTAAVAHSLRRDRGYDSRNYNRLLLGAASTSSTAPRISKTAEKPTLGKRVGGWIFGQWGVAPAQTALSGKRAKAVLSALDESAGDVTQRRSVRSKKEKDENRLSARVEAVSVDSTLLQESLGEG